MGDSSRIIFVTLHPQSERLHASHKQPGILRSQNGSYRIVQECHLIRELLALRNNETCQHIVMASKVFGGTMNDNICAKLDRALKKRSKERVVNNRKQALRLCPCRHSLQIGNHH
ncbi:hypothetical protein D3C80_1707190 [compost metagenome]